MSPLLFILVIKGLSLLIEDAKRNGKIKGIHISSQLHLTHLPFGDDVILFVLGSCEEWIAFKSILDSFCEAYGMCINIAKSCFLHNDLDASLLGRITGLLHNDLDASLRTDFPTLIKASTISDTSSNPRAIFSKTGIGLSLSLKNVSHIGHTGSYLWEAVLSSFDLYFRAYLSTGWPLFRYHPPFLTNSEN